MQELQGFKASDDRALADLQSKIQVVCRDAETSATSCRSMQKSMKHVEASLQDMRLSLDRHDMDLTELKRDVQGLPGCAKRVDDLWRHVEGLRSSVAQQDRAKELVENFEPRAARPVRWPARPQSPRPEPARPEPVAVKRRDARFGWGIWRFWLGFRVISGGFRWFSRAFEGFWMDFQAWRAGRG